MLIRKSRIQNLINDVIEKAEKSKDEYWKKEIKNRVDKKEAELILDLQCKEAESQILNRRISALEEKIKTADIKYSKGQNLIKKAKYILQAIREEHNLMVENQIAQKQRFLTLSTDIEETERKLTIEKKDI